MKQERERKQVDQQSRRAQQEGFSEPLVSCISPPDPFDALFVKLQALLSPTPSSEVEMNQAKKPRSVKEEKTIVEAGECHTKEPTC